MSKEEFDRIVGYMCAVLSLPHVPKVHVPDIDLGLDGPTMTIEVQHEYPMLTLIIRGVWGRHEAAVRPRVIALLDEIIGGRRTWDLDERSSIRYIGNDGSEIALVHFGW